jgi:hypothetical protein
MCSFALAPLPCRQLLQQIRSFGLLCKIRAEIIQVAFCQSVLLWVKRVVDPKPFAPVSNKACPVEDPQMSGCLGLGNPEHIDKVADTKLPVVEQEQKHSESGFIAEDLKK